MRLAIIVFLGVVLAFLPFWVFTRELGYAISGWLLLLGIVLAALRAVRAI
jgi:hypothetical protein